jgi:pimeloyl-ACP methyl ester carboxylesterase
MDPICPATFAFFFAKPRSRTPSPSTALSAFSSSTFFQTPGFNALIDYLRLDGFILVVQDWGGSIGLSVAVDRPESVAGMVILSPHPPNIPPGWLHNDTANPPDRDYPPGSGETCAEDR